MALINKKASGENIHLKDSASSKVVEFGLYGKATQDGEPTPDNPIEIVVSGSDGSVEVVSCGKNLLKNNAESQTINGVTFTVNDDGSVTANGTSTNHIWKDYHISASPSVIEGDYILNGCPSGGGSSTYRLNIVDRGTENIKDVAIYSDDGNGATVPFDTTHYYRYQIRIYNNVTLNNLVFKPMIRLASDTDDTYEPYKETTSTIPTPDGLCGIKVSSGGNYTDENGQQWICDEVVKYADGSGQRVQRIGTKVLDGTESWENGQLLNSDSFYRYFIKTENFNIKKTQTPVLCNYFMYYESGAWYADKEGIYLYSNDLINIDIASKIQTQDEWRVWLAENKPSLSFILAEPIITDLTAEEIAEIEKLHTFYPITNIYNDAECGMAVEYQSLYFAFLEPKTDWKPTDRFNYEDYNRIKNNLEYLHTVASMRIKPFEIENMGEDITDYSANWNVNVFNAFENNLHTINENVINANIGTKQTFYENGVFISYFELNRIESALVQINATLENVSAGIRRIPFTLGRFKARI